MGDWMITAGILAIILVLCLAWLAMDARIRDLEKEIKTLNDAKKLGDLEVPSIHEYVAKIEEELEQTYNKSYGDPTVMDWFDKQYEGDDKQ